MIVLVKSLVIIILSPFAIVVIHVLKASLVARFSRIARRMVLLVTLACKTKGLPCNGFRYYYNFFKIVYCDNIGKY